MGLRFGLRTLMVLFSLSCAIFGTLGSRWLEDRRQQEMVQQCEKMLSSEGKTTLSRDRDKNAYFDFSGHVSLASARALCNGNYVRRITIHGPLSEEAATILQGRYTRIRPERYADPDPPSVLPDIWARPDDTAFIQFHENSGHKVFATHNAH